MKINKIFAVVPVILIIFISLSFLTSCCCTFGNIFKDNNAGTEANIDSDKIAKKVDLNLVNINTNFALSLFSELSERDKNNNVFISPLSISLIMAMAYNGSENQTRKEIAEALQYKNFTDEQLNSAFNTLLLSMEDVDDMVKLQTGNSIWLKNNIVIEKNFEDLVKNYYNASIYSEDFNNPDTAGKINKWTSDVTEGRISNMVSPDALKDSVMCFINAIYFKGQWSDKFLPENTKEEDFFLIDKSTKKVQMMNQSEEYYYFDGDNFKILRIPYGRNKTAMYIILPDEDFNINEFISSLSTDLINEYIEDSKKVEVILKFPKLNIEYESANIVESLKNLGIKDVFIKDRADFERISQQLFISQIEQKAIIEVNEEGTVAAAGGSFQGFMAEIPKDFIVNRPFILFIRDDRTGNILFTGKILEP